MNSRSSFGPQPSNELAFIPSSKFTGRRMRYAFHNGENGVGYYLDPQQAHLDAEPESVAEGSAKKRKAEDDTGHTYVDNRTDSHKKSKKEKKEKKSKKSSKKKDKKDKKSKKDHKSKHSKKDKKKSDKRSKKSSRHSSGSSSSSSSSSDESSSSSSDSDSDSERDGDRTRRSIITGKKIRMSRDVTIDDQLLEIERAAKRHYMNSQY